MIRVPRWLVSVTGLAFAYYYVWVGVLWVGKYANPLIGNLALAIYAILVTLTFAAYRGLQLPMYQAVLNLMASVALPYYVSSQISTAVEGTFATWYLGACGLLMAATAVRGHRWLPWIGVVALLVHIVWWGGPEFIFNSGFVGVVLFVAAGQGISAGLRATSRRAEAYRELASATAAATAEKSAARSERQRLIGATLAGSLPILQRIVDTKGQLSAQEREQALLLEASLRDEIRGRYLMSPEVRSATLAARKRGVEVLLLDDGGLDAVALEIRERIHQEVAAAIQKVDAGKITVRTVRGEQHLVTVVATRPDQVAPDVWLKLG